MCEQRRALLHDPLGQSQEHVFQLELVRGDAVDGDLPLNERLDHKGVMHQRVAQRDQQLAVVALDFFDPPRAVQGVKLRYGGRCRRRRTLQG